MQKASFSEYTYSNKEIDRIIEKAGNTFAEQGEPVYLLITAPALSCTILKIDEAKLTGLLESLIGTILPYTYAHRIKISYRMISGKQLIFYIKNEGTALSEEQQDECIEACSLTKGRWKQPMEEMNGSIGVEFMPKHNITFWFTVS